MRHSPLLLIAVCLLCGILAAGGYLGGSLLAPYTLALVLCIAAGYAGMLWAATSLRNEVRNQRWPAETLARYHRIIGHGLWRTSLLLLFVGTLASLIPRAPHHAGWFWAFFVLLQTHTQLSAAFKPASQPSMTTTLLGISRGLPLRSSHWGGH